MANLKKVGGYVISVVGLILLAISLDLFGIGLFSFEGISQLYISGLGVVLIVIGVIISLMFDKKEKVEEKHIKEEVPIYVGEGKKRRIVGYRRSSSK